MGLSFAGGNLDPFCHFQKLSLSTEKKRIYVRLWIPQKDLGRHFYNCLSPMLSRIFFELKSSFFYR